MIAPLQWPLIRIYGWLAIAVEEIERAQGACPPCRK
jgi:hypothetical protein